MLTYWLRQKLHWSGLTYHEHPSEMPLIPPTDRGKELFFKYDLARWTHQIKRKTLDESLGTLDLLDRLPLDRFDALSRQARIRALDIGSKNWRYLPALVAWATRVFPHKMFELQGIELDAYRMYLNLRTRLSYARYFSKVCGSEDLRLHYQAGDVRSWKGTADLVFWVFPFVVLAPHRAWGLPAKTFDPRETFKHVEKSMEPGGRLIMANQGKWEWQEAKKMLGSLKLEFETVVEGSLHASPHPIFLSVWTREA